MEHMQIASDNYVAFTFFIGTMAMMAASVFFFFELSNTSPQWRTSILVSGLITFKMQLCIIITCAATTWKTAHRQLSSGTLTGCLLYL